MDELHRARRLLGVDPGASKNDIQRAFREAAKKYHPDMGGESAEFSSIEKAFRLVDASVCEPHTPLVAVSGRYASSPRHVAASRRTHRRVGSSFATVLARHLRDQPAGTVR